MYRVHSLEHPCPDMLIYLQNIGMGVVLVLFIDIENLLIHATFADINNVEYNINIETYHLTGKNIMFFIQIKDNI